MMKADLTRMADDEVECDAVLAIAGESDEASRRSFDAAIREDPSIKEMLATLRDVDVALRSIADAESPSVAEMRRTREGVVRLARTRAVPLVERSFNARLHRVRRLPRWSIAAAAAVLAVVGVVGWLSTTGPVGLPAKQVPRDVPFAQRDPRNQWVDDWRDYADLVPAFSPIDVRPSGDAAVAPDTLDEGDSQVDALTMLDTMSPE